MIPLRPGDATYPGPFEVTLEGLLEGEKVDSVLLFKQPLTYEEAMLVKAGWEAGLRAARSQDTKPESKP